MIDTIKLSLPKGMYWMNEANRFQKGKIVANRGYATIIQNPLKSELKAGTYKPKLTETTRFNATGRSELTLSVELSLPKLLYGNNFDELQDSDFEVVINALQKVLKTMGVKVFKDVLKNAPVSAIHYSKNIILTDGTTPHYIISKIQEANISLSIGTDQTNYRDGGYSYKWHTNAYEVAFYDKLRELEQAKVSEKRAIEKDNSIQLNLFGGIDKKQPFEVLRMEVRLNNRQATKKILEKLNIEPDLTFEQLFSSDISKKVLTHYLSEVKAKRPKILDYRSKDTKSTLTDIVINNPKMTPAKVFQTLGVKLALDSIPTRELRAVLGKTKKQYWYKLNSDVKKVNLPVTTNAFNVLDEALNKFETAKTVDFQGVLINNDKYK